MATHRFPVVLAVIAAAIMLAACSADEDPQPPETGADSVSAEERDDADGADTPSAAAGDADDSDVVPDGFPDDLPLVEGDVLSAWEEVHAGGATDVTLSVASRDDWTATARFVNQGVEDSGWEYDDADAGGFGDDPAAMAMRPVTADGWDGVISLQQEEGDDGPIVNYTLQFTPAD